MAAVKDKSLDVLGVRDIYNKWQLYYYCKESYKGKTVKNYLNKKKFFNLRIVDLDDIVNIDNNVFISSEKA